MKKISKQAIQKHLDVIAETLEQSGFRDLSARVDYYSNRLMTASIDEAILIKRALTRVSEEIRRRLVAGEKNKPPIKVPKKEEPEEKSVEKGAPKNREKTVADARKEVLRKRLAALKETRNKVAQRLEALKNRQAESKKISKAPAKSKEPSAEYLKKARQDRLEK